MRAPAEPRPESGSARRPRAPHTPALPFSEPRLLGRKEAAVYLGVSEWTLRDLEAAGRLPRVRLPLQGRDVDRVLYDRSDLDRLIDTSKVGA